MWAFSETIDGISEVCRALGVPVTGGNVSLYNETEGRGIYPTPVIGMLGRIEDAKHITTQWFKEAGACVVLLGATHADLGASELLAQLTGETRGAVPRLDLAAELAVQNLCLAAIQEGLVQSAHDCSDGGLAVALAECCFSSYRRPAIGARLDLSEHMAQSGLNDPTTLLFSESPSRILLSVKAEHLARVRELASGSGVPCALLGETGGETLQITCNGQSLVTDSIATLERAWRGALPAHLDRAVAAG
jgi:phosphoribosylformylglycinamidine synthase